MQTWHACSLHSIQSMCSSHSTVSAPNKGETPSVPYGTFPDGPLEPSKLLNLAVPPPGVFGPRANLICQAASLVSAAYLGLALKIEFSGSVAFRRFRGGFGYCSASLRYPRWIPFQPPSFSDCPAQQALCTSMLGFVLQSMKLSRENPLSGSPQYHPATAASMAPYFAVRLAYTALLVFRLRPLLIVALMECCLFSSPSTTVGGTDGARAVGTTLLPIALAKERKRERERERESERERERGRAIISAGLCKTARVTSILQ